MVVARAVPFHPTPQAGPVEAVERAGSVDPGAQPPRERRPPARRLEKIPPYMRPTKDPEQLVTVLGQALVGTVTVTPPHLRHQVLAPLGTIPLEDLSPPPRRHTGHHHRGRLPHPAIPAMPRCPVDVFTHLPSRFIAMAERGAHLPLIQLGQHGLKEHRDFVPPIGDGPWGQQDPGMLARLADPRGGAAIAVLVEQHRGPA